MKQGVCGLRWVSFFVFGVLAAFCCLPAAHAATYSGGSGTEIDPYLISTVQDLRDLSNPANSADWSKYFRMTNNINMTGVTGFRPIARDTDAGSDGFQGTAFTGVFDGGGRAVQNLTIAASTQDYVGLFGYISGPACQIKNLGMQGGTISGKRYVGGLVGYNNAGTVTACYAKGNTTANGFVGGLVCINSAGTVAGCYATGAVSNIDTQMYSGAGGLIGSNTGTVTACYATATVSGPSKFGKVGGLVGHSSSTFAVGSSFWDIETSGELGSAGGKGLTTAQMKTVRVIRNAGWAAYGWVMTQGQYPRLPWEGTGMPTVPAPEPVALSGSGTAGAPYLVGTPEEFALLSWRPELLAAHIQLTANIDCAGLTVYPIGDLGTFTGVFDGAGRTIANVTIDQSQSDYVGVFSSLASGGEIRDVGVKGCHVTGGDYVGGLVGENRGTVTNCFVTGTVVGMGVEVGGFVGTNRSPLADCHATAAVSAGGRSTIGILIAQTGGLVGRNYSGGAITDCYAKGEVASAGLAVGGMVGYDGGATVTRCYATGNVEGGDSVGGLIGISGGTILHSYTTNRVVGGDQVGGLAGTLSGTARRCYATGEIFGTGNDGSIGGLAGSNTGTITDCYAAGGVSGTDNVGGLVGENSSDGMVANCYATGPVLGDSNLGGLVGILSGGSVTTSFWDIMVGGPDNGIGAGLPTADMRQRAIFEAAGWDFSVIDGDPADWFIAEHRSYPVLFGMPTPITSAGTLQLLNASLDGEFFLTNDIDASETVEWADKSALPGFLPIGSAVSPFTGNLDGNGHRIYGVHIYRPSLDQVGLFGYIGATGVVRRVGLENVVMTGRNQVGGLAGVSLGTIEQCYARGDIIGVNSVGGLVGTNQGNVTESYAATTLSGDNIGGLIGADNGGSVSISFWDTEISATLSSGGGTGLATSAMQSEGIFADADWDMTSTWSIVGSYSYPYFQNSVGLCVLSGPPRLIGADDVEIVVRAFIPQLFVTVGGARYPAYHKFDAAGQATISVPLKQEAINNIRISTLSESGVERVIADYEVYESEAFPPIPTAVTALTLSPSSLSMAEDATQQFRCSVTFADGMIGDVTPVCNWNLSGGGITANGLYTHHSGTVTVQGLLHTQDGWHYSNLATVTTVTPKSGSKSGTGLVSGVVLSHYTGLGLIDGRVTGYGIYAPVVEAQHPVLDTMGNYAFFINEGIYHFEGACPGHRSQLVRGGYELEEPQLVYPGPPPRWSERHYSGEIKAGRALQQDFALRPNDTQAPWVVFIEPVADTTVKTNRVVVTAIDTDKYSELAAAQYTHNAQLYEIPEKISSTGFYRDTWPLELGLNVLHLYTMDTEGNASEKTIQITYDPNYVVPGTDSDKDGMPNAWETAHGLNPNSAEGVNGADGDLDGDGLTNLQEYHLGSFPNSAHSDADTLPDGFEFDLGTSLVDADTDGDGVNDDVEWELGGDPLHDDRVHMAVVNFADGTAVRGNAVTVLAEVLGEGNSGAIASVSIEVKGPGTGGVWRVLNTDAAAPITARWDTTGYVEGTYQLRAVATSWLGHVDDGAATVPVNVSGSAAYHERIEGGLHMLTAPVSASSDTVLALWDGMRFARILIPAGALPAADVLTAFFPNASGFTPSLSVFQHDAGLYLNVSLISGLTNFTNGKKAVIHLSYPDADRDDHLDDTGLLVPFLSLAHLPTPAGAFAAIASSSIDRGLRCVVGETSHFSTFGIVEAWPAPPLNILTNSLPSGTIGAAYNAALEANGGTPPYTWSLASGALPDGLSIAGNGLQGTPAAAGDFSFTLQVTDSQSPPYAATAAYGVSIYAANQPAVTVTRAVGQPGIASGLPATWNIVFSEAVTGFETADVVLEGTASYGATYNVTGGDADYTLQVTALTYDGTLHPTVPAGVCASVDTSTLNCSSTDEEEVWVDSKAPLAQWTCSYAGAQVYGTTTPIVVTALPVVFALTFSEDVEGLEAADIQFAESIPGLLYSVQGSGRDYVVIIDGANSATAMTPRVVIDAVLDSAGNGNAETAYVGRQVQYAPDSRALVTLNQRGTQADPTNSLPMYFDIEFSESVTGFETGDVLYIGAAPPPTYEVSGSGAAYTLEVTEDAGDGLMAFVILEDVVPEGNLPSSSMDNLVTLDTTLPGISIGAPSTSSTENGPVSYTVTYAGATTVTLADDNIALNGTATAEVSVTGTGKSLRVVTLSNILGSGPLGISIAPATATDAAGNIAPAAGPSATFTVMASPSPTVTVNQSASQIDPANNLPVVFDVVFSHDVTGFDETGVRMGGTAADVTFDVDGSGATYAIEVTAVTGDGTIVPTIPAGMCQDGMGNYNMPSTSTDNVVTYDGTPPTLTVEQATGQADPTSVLPIGFAVVFSEPVTGFTVADVTQSGTATGVSFTVTPVDATHYTVQATAVSNDGTVQPAIAAGRCTDLAGNPNEASTSIDNNVTYDSARPTVTVNQSAGQADPTNNLPILFDVVFSEPVYGFDASKVTLGGTATGVAFDVNGADDFYSLTVTGITGEGSVIPSIAPQVCHDLAGNANTASTATDNRVTYDVTGPEFSGITAVPSPAGESAVVTISFSASEPLAGVPAVTVNGNAAVQESHSGLDYVFTYTVLASDPNGPATIILSGTDNAGNAGQTEDTVALVIDHTKPTANFSASPRSGQPPLEVQFLEGAVRVQGVPITVWTWDFGDASPPVSGQTPPPHTYTEPGLYTVTLTITDAAMNSDTETKTAYIVVGGPKAAFSAMPTAGYAPLAVQFTDLSSPGALPITAWHWDFGDGVSSDERHAGHVYAEPGDYSVTLTVTNAVINDSKTVFAYIVVGSGVTPTADFRGTPLDGPVPLTVKFMDQSDPGTSPIEEWLWDFGDGETGYEQHPVHVYEAPGDYTVSLTVTTAVDSDMLTRYNYIHVGVAMHALAWTGLALLAALLALGGAVFLQDWTARSAQRIIILGGPKGRSRHG